MTKAVDLALVARVEALKAAMQLRTPGTSPEVALATADVFLRWLLDGSAPSADNRRSPAR